VKACGGKTRAVTPSPPPNDDIGDDDFSAERDNHPVEESRRLSASFALKEIIIAACSRVLSTPKPRRDILALFLTVGVRYLPTQPISYLLRWDILRALILSELGFAPSMTIRDLT
jgi:hypothetical protein